MVQLYNLHRPYRLRGEYYCSLRASHFSSPWIIHRAFLCETSGAANRNHCVFSCKLLWKMLKSRDFLKFPFCQRKSTISDSVWGGEVLVLGKGEGHISFRVDISGSIYFPRNYIWKFGWNFVVTNHHPIVIIFAMKNNHFRLISLFSFHNCFFFIFFVAVDVGTKYETPSNANTSSLQNPTPVETKS